jgi:hypothetical protein
MIKIQNTKPCPVYPEQYRRELVEGIVLNIRYWDLRVCLGFRIWDLGFRLEYN